MGGVGAAGTGDSEHHHEELGKDTKEVFGQLLL